MHKTFGTLPTILKRFFAIEPVEARPAATPLIRNVLYFLYSQTDVESYIYMKVGALTLGLQFIFVAFFAYVRIRGADDPNILLYGYPIATFSVILLLGIIYACGMFLRLTRTGLVGSDTPSSLHSAHRAEQSWRHPMWFILCTFCMLISWALPVWLVDNFGEPIEGPWSASGYLRLTVFYSVFIQLTVPSIVREFINTLKIIFRLFRSLFSFITNRGSN